MSCMSLPAKSTDEQTSTSVNDHPNGDNHQLGNNQNREMVRYQTTHDGDVQTVVVKTPFDAEDSAHQSRKKTCTSSNPGDERLALGNAKNDIGTYQNKEDGAMKAPGSPPRDDTGEQSRSDDEQQPSLQPIESRLSPLKDAKGHSRNLSAHFFNATKLSDDSPHVPVDDNGDKSKHNPKGGQGSSLTISSPSKKKSSFFFKDRGTAPCRSPKTGDRHSDLSQQKSYGGDHQQHAWAVVSSRSFHEDTSLETSSSLPFSTGPGGAQGNVPSPRSCRSMDARGFSIPVPARHHLPPPSPSAAAIGQKHRRVFSGGLSNPAVAHRRINSSGISAPVDKGNSGSYGSYGESSKQGLGFPAESTSRSDPSSPVGQYIEGGHHRENSAGLEMLSAAADVSKDELAAAAGARGGRPSPPNVQRFSYRGSPPSHLGGRTGMHQHGRGGNPTAVSSSGSGGSFDYPNYPGSTSSAGARDGGMHPPPYHSIHRSTLNSSPPEQSYHYYQGIGDVGSTQHLRQNFYETPPSFFRISPPSSSPYPVQYAQPGGGGANGKHRKPPPETPILTQASSQTRQSPRSSLSSSSFGSDKIETDERLFANKNCMPPPQALRSSSTSSGWNSNRGNGGTTTGVQALVTAISAGDGNRTLQAASNRKNMSTNAESSSYRNNHSFSTLPVSEEGNHHRTLSSFSSIGTFTGPNLFPEVDNAASDSATPCLESGEAFLRNMSSQPSAEKGGILDRTENNSFGAQGPPSSSAFAPSVRTHSFSRSSPTGEYGERYNSQEYISKSNTFPTTGNVQNSYSMMTENDPGERTVRKFAPGSSSKRIRRKCTVANCNNRVVQGGLCISHGAKRKTCSHPGCTKNVKKAGLCSAHGPARKRCEFEGCAKVAVQGGRCIAHGAKKKLCSVEDCTKQAILAGMCKKHHDQKHGVVTARASRRQSIPNVPSDLRSSTSQSPPLCVEINSKPRHSPSGDNELPSGSQQQPGHRRGLSIFQDMNAVNTIIREDSINGSVQRQPPGAEARGTRESVTRSDRDSDAYLSREVSRDEASGDPPPHSQQPPSQQQGGRQHHQRGLSLFTDENISESIIKNDMII